MLTDIIYMVILKNRNCMMKGSRMQQTRQIYASIREDLYLAAKAKAAERRVPLKRLIEDAIEALVFGDLSDGSNLTGVQGGEIRINSIWDDEYLGIQLDQPIGTPFELSSEEALRILKSSETFYKD